MTLRVDRRLLLKAGTLGLGVLAVPGAAQIVGARGFTHNVASGEPKQGSVMLWTRYVPAGGGEARLEYEVARTAGFAKVDAGGSVAVSPERDWTVKPVAGDLAPGQWYFYRFVAPDGSMSPVGRTRTLPQGPVARFGLGVFSCSNLPFGFFNAYAHAAARDDLDLMVHLGDYLYEYPRGRYPSEGEATAGRTIWPAGETVALADYRLRHAAYRADPDLQRLHQLFPMVMMWDDHESANDSWKGGAENHQPESEGEWTVRKAAAVRACREWLPVSDNDLEIYPVGDLATIFRPETRLTGRDEPLDLAAALVGQGDLRAELVAFRDGPWRDPARTMLGIEQERRLYEGIAASARGGARWQVLAQQVVVGSFGAPPETAAWIPPDAPAETRRRAMAGAAAAKAGIPLNLDAWDGYPAARERLLRAALDADANLVTLAGDSHNAWAFDLMLDKAAAGVDMATQSVTSPGFEAYLPKVPADEVAAALVRANPELRWADTSRRGYMTVELTPERATGEWLFLDTIRQRSTTLSGRHRMGVPHGARRFDA